MLNGAWRYRFFILSSIQTEFRAKFIGSRLGGLWMIFHPLSQVFILTFVFSALLSAKLPRTDNQHAYAIFLMSGTLGWSLFSEIVTRCLTVFIDNGNILKKLVFPRIALPLIIVGSTLVNNSLLLIAILSIFGLYGHAPGMALIWLPALLVVNIALALGLGLILSVLNVFVRDVGQIIPVVLQFLFWLTPIAYMADIIPKQYQKWLVFNPMIPIIKGYHNVLFFKTPPDLAGLGKVALVSFGLLFFALVLFRKAGPDMVDQL
jgi:lipopolysaccharide transport system permease protein